MMSPGRTQAPPLPTSPPPNVNRPGTITNNGSGGTHSSVTPPEKSPVTPPQTSPRPKSDKKTVSFNENVATNEPPESPVDSPPAEKVREDPNVSFLDFVMLSSLTELLQNVCSLFCRDFSLKLKHCYQAPGVRTAQVPVEL